jgi:hypothetical protein
MSLGFQDSADFLQDVASNLSVLPVHRFKTLFCNSIWCWSSWSASLGALPLPVCGVGLVWYCDQPGLHRCYDASAQHSLVHTYS